LSAVLTVATFIELPALLPAVQEALAAGPYAVRHFDSLAKFLQFIELGKQEIDCLVVQSVDLARPEIEQLYSEASLLPIVFVVAAGADPIADTIYNFSEVVVSVAQLGSPDKVLDKGIEQAIAKFLSLGKVNPIAEVLALSQDRSEQEDSKAFLLRQQRRLSEKLNERLGYLAVYYNRNPQHFFRHLNSTERSQLSLQLQKSYRQIVLCYFATDSNVNDLLDEFVTLVFFADLSVSEVVEIHMDLMEDFSKQLKMEGWSEDILLDYRLTLIDTIAHLCEMYRRSVPRE
jgi:circadian clock protein KaiA